MLRYELTPNNAGFILWGDSEALNELHELIHYIVDEGNDSNLLIVFYVQIVPDDFVMQLHRFGERQGLPAQPCQMLSQIQVVSLNSLRVTLTDDVQFSLQT